MLERVRILFGLEYLKREQYPQRIFNQTETGSNKVLYQEGVRKGQHMGKKKRKKKAGIANRPGKTRQKKNQNRQSDIKYQKLRTKTKSMLNELGLSKESMEFIEPPDGVKMSEVILKLADPLLKKYGDDDKLIETIISLTITVWNKLMFPEDEQEKLQNEMIDYMVPKSGDAENIGMIVYINC
jgi:hypothetical protein